MPLMLPDPETLHRSNLECAVSPLLLFTLNKPHGSNSSSSTWTLSTVSRQRMFVRES